MCRRIASYIFIVQGLQCVELATEASENNGSTRTDTEAMSVDRSRPIPLGDTSSTCAQRALIPFAVRRPTTSVWQTELSALLLLRAAVAYRLLAERALSLEHVGRAVRLVHNAVVCICTFTG